MNYYSHHMGDFNNATRHLTRIERSIYLDLIHLYYDTEKPLTLDFAALCRKIIAKTEEEATAVQQVLNEFFTETGAGWFHARCEEEISSYHINISAKSAAGKASAAKREAEKLAKLNECSTAVQQPLNSVDSSVELTIPHSPITNNQEPLKTTTSPQAASAKAPKYDFRKVLADEGVPKQSIEDWMKVRKAKRAVDTEASFALFRKEAAKAGLSIADAVSVCAGRSWAGLDADWLKPKSQAAPQAYQTTADKNKAFADRLTGRTQNEQRNPAQRLIDIN